MDGVKLFELVDGIVTRVSDWPKDETALELSIQKWEFIVECIKSGQAVKSDGSSNGTCALCADFSMLGCNGCPVKEAIGNSGCIDTPYNDWYPPHPISLDIAEAELEFLKGLR